MWAAYQMGMWGEQIYGGLSRDAFQEVMIELMGEAAYDWIVEAPGKDGVWPVALALGMPVTPKRNSLDQECIEPFVEWFPWSTTRNQVEATAVFLKEIAPRLKVFVFADEAEDRFWSSFVRRGMIRRGCKILDYFARGEHALMYYTVGT